MTISNYPNGFQDGLTVKGVPVELPHPGKVFWVNNSGVLAANGISGSDGNPGTYQKPFETIDYAIGRCKANRGDVIYVMPGHSETVNSAGFIALDVAGVSIIGLGKGDLRPLLTSNGSTAATANMTITAADTSIANLRFVGDDAGDDQVNLLLITADDVEVAHCDFRGGTTEPLNYVTIGAADADSDRFLVHDCNFFAKSGGVVDNAIEVLFDMAGGAIKNNKFFSEFDEAAIFLPAGANACTDLEISGNEITMTLATIPAVDISGSAVTGIMRDNVVVTNAAEYAVNVAAMKVFEDQSPRSIISKAVALTGGDVADVFTVTGGPVLITQLAVRVTTAVSANAALLHFESDPLAGASTTDLAEGSLAPDIASAAIGDIFSLNGDSQDIMRKCAHGTDLPVMENQNGGLVCPAGGIDLKLSTSDPSTGIGDVIVSYIPMAPHAQITL